MILVCFEKESPRCSPPCSYLIFRPSGSCSASLQKNLFYGKTHLDFDFNMISMFLAHIVKTPIVNKRSPSATAVQIVFHLNSQITTHLGEKMQYVGNSILKGTSDWSLALKSSQMPCTKETSLDKKRRGRTAKGMCWQDGDVYQIEGSPAYTYLKLDT